MHTKINCIKFYPNISSSPAAFAPTRLKALTSPKGRTQCEMLVYTANTTDCRMETPSLRMCSRSRQSPFDGLSNNKGSHIPQINTMKQESLKLPLAKTLNKCSARKEMKTIENNQPGLSMIGPSWSSSSLRPSCFFTCDDEAASASQSPGVCRALNRATFFSSGR